MIYLALGLLLLGALSALTKGDARRRGLHTLGAGLRGGYNLWRSTAGLLAIVLLSASLVLLIREDWVVAMPMGIVALGLAVSARKRKAAAIAVRPGTMSEAEARSILGVGPTATSAEIQAAYKRLMSALHPDRGGTVGLAAQLNAAREALVRRRR